VERLAPLALVLALLVAFEPAALARRKADAAAGLDRRQVALIVNTVEDDPVLVEERLLSDPRFRQLADEFLPARASRLGSGRALVGVGVVVMILSALVGTGLWFGDRDLRVPAAVATWGAGIGAGLVMFVPGVVLMATPAGAETDMVQYWKDGRAEFLRPDALQPGLRLAPGAALPRSAAFRVLSVPF
jgi:hypothetical protein